MECPKCHGAMRSYERNGITVDQCTECRGVFLDRGELEHLISLEAAQAAPPEYAQPTTQPRQPQGAPSYGKGSAAYGHKRRKNFLEELFD